MFGGLPILRLLPMNNTMKTSWFAIRHKPRQPLDAAVQSSPAASLPIPATYLTHSNEVSFDTCLSRANTGVRVSQ